MHWPLSFLTASYAQRLLVVLAWNHEQKMFYSKWNKKFPNGTKNRREQKMFQMEQKIVANKKCSKRSKKWSQTKNVPNGTRNGPQHDELESNLKKNPHRNGIWGLEAIVM